MSSRNLKPATQRVSILATGTTSASAAAAVQPARPATYRPLKSTVPSAMSSRVALASTASRRVGSIPEQNVKRSTDIFETILRILKVKFTSQLDAKFKKDLSLFHEEHKRELKDLALQHEQEEVKWQTANKESLDHFNKLLMATTDETLKTSLKADKRAATQQLHQQYEEMKEQHRIALTGLKETHDSFYKDKELEFSASKQKAIDEVADSLTQQATLLTAIKTDTGEPFFTIEDKGLLLDLSDLLDQRDPATVSAMLDGKSRDVLFSKDTLLANYKVASEMYETESRLMDIREGETIAKSAVSCQRCGDNRIIKRTKQMRSGDEGEDTRVTCISCNAQRKE